MPSETLNYLLARQAGQIINFSGSVSGSPTYLNGPGGAAGDGLPLPRDARILRLDCWDGATLASDQDSIAASQGDRISLHAQPNTGSMDVVLRVNGIDTALLAAGLASSATLQATLYLVFA